MDVGGQVSVQPASRYNGPSGLQSGGLQMHERFKNSVVAVAVTVLVVAFSVGVRPTQGQGQPPAYQAPRLPGTQQPDLNGIWQALNTANWNLESHSAGPSPVPRLLGAIGAIPPGLSVVEGNEIPYQDWALKQRQDNFETRLARPLDVETNLTAGDPEAKCYMPGVPRATYMPYPFQIVQTPNQVLMAYEFAGATRIIHVDREPRAPAAMWMGWSIATWEGDTLVVDVTRQLEGTWFDRAGNFHSDELHVVEHYTPVGPNHLQYEATIEDSKVFTRPWTISMPLYRRTEPNAQLLEFKCIEFAEPFMYGHILEDATR